MNKGSTTAGLYVEAEGIAVSSSSLEREGLKRRRKQKTFESSPSEANLIDIVDVK